MSAAKLARERSTDYLVNNLLPQANFTETPSDSILCLICKKVLKHPMQLSCGHRVCKLCNENSIPTHNGERRCPVDGDVIDRVFPDRSALIDIMNLGCFCVSYRDGCTWQGLVLDLELHVLNCDFCVKISCPFKEFRCEFTGSRGEMNRHLTEDFVKHDCLLATSLKECLNHVDGNSWILASIKEGTSSIESSFVEVNKEVAALQNKLDETTLMVDDLQNTNAHKLKERYHIIEELLARSTNKKSQFIVFHTKFKDLLKKVDNQMKYLNESEQGSGSGDSMVSTNKTTLTDKVKRLGDFNDSHGKQINELSIKIRIAQCSNNNGNYTWKLDNLRNRFNEAMKGKVRELYTPPLYTSNFGYKYSAKVMLAGEKDKVNSNNANHMGFYIVLMQGDYDEILQFPFPYPIEITLINFGNNPSITHTLYPDPNKVHFEKPYKNMNPAIGFARFCSHEKLKSDGFIKNDTIYFNITVKRTGVRVNEPDI